MNNKSKELAKNTLLLAVGNILTKGLLFVMVPFFSSWLSTEDYGAFDLFCTYVSLLIPFATLATGEAIFRFSVESESTEYDIKRNVTNGLLLVTSSFIVICGCLSIYFAISGWTMFIPFILLLLGELYNNHLQSFLRAIKKLNIYSFCSAFTVVFIAIIVTIFVRFLDLGLKGIILGYAFGYIVGDVIIALISHYRRYIDLSLIGKDVINKLIRYSYPLIPNSVSWWIMNVSDRFFINIFIGVAANGIYAIANKIPALCSAVFSVFNISWQQTASEVVESGNTDEIANYFNRVFNVVLNKLLSICIGVMSCNFIFFNYIFDKKYFEGYLYSPILISAIIFMVMSTFYGGIQISLKMPKENGITTMAGAACNIVINVILINFLGLYAAAISTFCAYLLVEELRRIKLKNIVSFKLSKINLVSIIIFVYYLVCAYLIGYKILSWTNFILACIIFIYLNKDIFMLIWNKTLRVLRK